MKRAPAGHGIYMTANVADTKRGAITSVVFNIRLFKGTIIP